MTAALEHMRVPAAIHKAVLFLRIAVIACLAAFFSTAVSGTVGAQTRERAGILREIQSRLMQAPGVEVWEEARRLPGAEDAASLMEHLAGRTQDPVYSARANIWLGHYHYGAGHLETALQYFVRAGAGGGSQALREEASFWAAQCRNLLGIPSDTQTSGEGTDGPTALFRRLAELDGKLRLGDLDKALSGYLSLEGEARRVRCLAPLYYRLGLVLNAGAGRGALDASIVRGWDGVLSGTAERALVRAHEDAAPWPRADDRVQTSGIPNPPPAALESSGSPSEPPVEEVKETKEKAKENAQEKGQEQAKEKAEVPADLEHRARSAHG